MKRDGRHGAWAHPFFTMMGLFTAVITITILAHDFIVSYSDEYKQSMAELGPHKYNFEPWIAYFFLAYLFVMILSRYIDCGSYIFYESVWCCNTSLILASVGILTHRPLLVGASIAGVCCDQLMWYIDCLGYVIIGKFKVGVAKYLLWPETSWSKKYLCTHHLWFMPLALYALGWHLPIYSFILSCIFTSASTGLCRFTTPKTWKDIYNNHEHYMNINAAHEFWKDVHIPALHYFNKHPTYVYLPFMMICQDDTHTRDRTPTHTHPHPPAFHVDVAPPLTTILPLSFDVCVLSLFRREYWPERPAIPLSQCRHVILWLEIKTALTPHCWPWEPPTHPHTPSPHSHTTWCNKQSLLSSNAHSRSEGHCAFRNNKIHIILTWTTLPPT